MIRKFYIRFVNTKKARINFKGGGWKKKPLNVGAGARGKQTWRKIRRWDIRCLSETRAFFSVGMLPSWPRQRIYFFLTNAFKPACFSLRFSSFTSTPMASVSAFYVLLKPFLFGNRSKISRYQTERFFHIKKNVALNNLLLSYRFIYQKTIL